MVAKRVIYEGRVQGVGFRYTVKDLARGFEVVGTVRNLPDGTVELEAMGEREEIEAFLHEIREESPVAGNIRNALVETIPPLVGVTGFTIAR